MLLRHMCITRFERHGGVTETQAPEKSITKRLKNYDQIFQSRICCSVSNSLETQVLVDITQVKLFIISTIGVGYTLIPYLSVFLFIICVSMTKKQTSPA